MGNAAARIGGETTRFRPHGFDSLGLQFALDYAYFLKRTNRPGEARDVLLEPLRVLDMDRNPNVTFPQPPGAGDPDGLPVRVCRFDRCGIRFGPVGVPRKEFIRLVHGEFKHAGRAGAIADGVAATDRSGENRARRVLAQLKLHQGETEAALALELGLYRSRGIQCGERYLPPRVDFRGIWPARRGRYGI